MNFEMPSLPRRLLLSAIVSVALSVSLDAAAALAVDRAPTAAASANHGNSRDVDGDGVPNGRDRDVDGDHVPNGRDRDVDGDGKPNGKDLDVDGDGIPNSRDKDIDGDGVPNGRDGDVDGDGITNGRDRDVDGDGKANSKDKDVDGDGVKNSKDPDVDGDKIRNGRDKDVDGDGVKNGRDKDVDGDGVKNSKDKDIDGDGIKNTKDPDMDGDGIPNNRDADGDGDGKPGVQNGAPKDPPASLRVPADFFGLVNENVLASNGASRDLILSQAADAGVSVIRQTFDWSQIEVLPGIYNFALYDQLVADTARHGFDLLGVLFNPPVFRSSRPLGNARNGTFPPSSNADFAAFAQAMVHRYGPGGSFWAAHPGIPTRPIHAWQVWGEPNVEAYWPTGPNPGQYTAMLQAVSGGIRALDPGAEIVTGALPNTANGIDPDTFLRGMYAAGAKGAFNTLSVNPYADTAAGVLELVRSSRTVMNQAGDGGKIWITEIGWASQGPGSKYTFDEQGQAELIRQVFNGLAAEVGKLNLRGIIYFNWQDAAPYPPQYKDFWGLHTGLIKNNGQPKPAFNAFRNTARRLLGR